MILDRESSDATEELGADTPDDGSDEGSDDADWLQGLRHTGLPVVTGGGGGAPSLAVRQLVADSWTPAVVSADVRALVERSLAPATRSGYEDDWREFAAWAALHGLDDPLQASEVDVAEYVATLVRARLAMATIRRRLAGIAFAFGLLQRPSPSRSELVRRTMLGAARTLGTAQRRAAPLRLEAMRTIVRALPIVAPNRRGMRRDQLLIALGWAGALRASDLVGLDGEDLHFVGDPDRGDGGLLLRIRRSKTDQTAAVEWVAIPYASQWTGCPVRLALGWQRRQRRGPLFRHVDRHGRAHRRLGADAVARILKPLIAEVLNDDPAPYSSHSLRAGFVTEARACGVPDELIKRHTRHRDRNRGDILAVYDRPTDLLERPALDPRWW